MLNLGSSLRLWTSSASPSNKAWPIHFRYALFHLQLMPSVLTVAVQKCLAVLVALETSTQRSLSTRAYSLHVLLHTKHAALVNSRFLECARKSFDYQRRIHPGNVHGQHID